MSEMTIAEKIDILFKHKKRPGGKEYTYKEVEEGTGGEISSAYLWKLRHGQSRNPSQKKLAALAAFFGAPPEYFFESDPERIRAHQLAVVLQAEGVEELAFRITELNEAGRKAILEMVEHIRLIQKGEQSTDETS